MIGAFRTWRSQNAIVRGKAITGGFEIILLAFGIFAVSHISPNNHQQGPDFKQIVLMFFVLLLAVDITKEYPT